MSVDAKELYKARALDYAKAANFQKPEHIPIMGSILTWPVGYYKMDLGEMLYKPEELAEQFCKIFDEVYMDVGHICGISTSIHTLEALGSDTFFISDDRSTIQHQQRCYMTPEDYDDLIKNPRDFMLNELGKRKLQKLAKGDEESYRTLVAAAKEQLIFNRVNPAIGKIMTEKYGIAPVYGKSKVYPPFDYIFDRLRGFAGTMTDCRRNRAKLLEATDAVYEYVKGWVAGAANQMGVGSSVGGDAMVGFPYAVSTLHCPAFMRPKDFEELYFPTFKLLVEAVYNTGSKTVLFNEGTWMPLVDIMKDMPYRSTVWILDEDDPIEMVKALDGTAAITAGVTLNKMKSLTKEQCIDEAKRILDGCDAGNGGVMFGTDKSLCGPTDVNIENYAAVNQFVHEYI